MQSLSLKYFINRSIVLHLYRQYLRTLKPLNRDLKSELHLRVRHEFETSRHVTESPKIQQLLREGRKQLKELETLADSATKHQKVESLEPTSSTSWLEGGGGDDTRGRIGVDWPWNR